MDFVCFSKVHVLGACEMAQQVKARTYDGRKNLIPEECLLNLCMHAMAHRCLYIHPLSTGVNRKVLRKR